MSLPELQRTLLAAVQQNYAYVTCIGLFGTYDDCLEWLKAPEQQSKSKIVLTLGSSVGNFKRNDAARFISQFGATLNDGDAIILGVDCCQSPEKVFRAYNDQRGVTHRFILNGLTHANRLLGRTEFVEHQWKVVGLYDKSVNCYRAYISPTEDTQVMGQVIVAGEKVLIEECYKYSESYLEQLYRAAGVSAGAAWYNSSKEHGMALTTLF